MVACISAYPFTLDETITTLNYAERAQGIRKEVVKNVKQVQFQCMRCKELMKSVSPQKVECQVLEDVSLWNSAPRIIQERIVQQKNEDAGIFMEVCQKLYQDIIENAREAEQIERLRNDIMSPCEEFELILRDNEDQRVHLKGILFNLLS